MASTLSNLINLLIFLSIIRHFQASSSPTFPNETLPTQSGYLSVNTATASAIFYIFYEAQEQNSSISEIPLLIWLQGGPGCSSMIGNFYELGPWRVHSNKQNVQHLELVPNLGSWNRLFGLLFIDNPIGVGFSIAATPQEIPKDQKSVAEHLFAAITAFIELNPLFKSRPIFITGESYGGKYVPAIGYYILNKNDRLPESKRVNLAGVAIGNGLTDPVIQVGTHAVNAYFSGLINENQKHELEKLQFIAIKLTKEGKWSEAADARNILLNRLQNMTGLATLYDYSKKSPYKTQLVTKFLQSEESKKALGVNTSMAFAECSDIVGLALHGDVMKSVKYMVEFLVKKTRVLLYQGHFDLRDGVVSTEAWVKTMKWEGIEGFLAAERRVWEVNGELAGYVQKWRNLSNVVVMGAGHLVPTDESLHSQAMVEDWVLQKGLFGDGDEKGRDGLEGDFHFRGLL